MRNEVDGRRWRVWNPLCRLQICLVRNGSNILLKVYFGGMLWFVEVDCAALAKLLISRRVKFASQMLRSNTKVLALERTVAPRTHFAEQCDQNTSIASTHGLKPK